MHSEPDLSTIAALIGDPARSTILSALLNGQSLPAGELAHRAHITPQTTSLHLSKLVVGGLLTMERMGRHRYYRLKNADVARALESLATISAPPRPQKQPDSADYQAICFARTCYDHLAGKLGVVMTQALLARGLIRLHDRTYAVTKKGSGWLASWNINEQELHASRRLFARTCLDWSERRYHVAGALGAAIANRLLDEGWVTRIAGNRALRLTEAGRKGLKRELAITL
jgi:DNA-binding transcriptional ArsR family regulator